MSLNFPNHSRSYDQTHSRVRFLGHDSAMEVAFFLEEDALLRLSPETQSNEAGILEAFDANRDHIINIARKAYAGRRANSCILVMKDFFR